MRTIGYDLDSPWPGMLTHHSDDCPAQFGKPCTCGPLGYRGSVNGSNGHAPVVGPVVPTVTAARAWQQDQKVATEAFEAAVPPPDTSSFQAPPPPAPADGNGFQAQPPQIHPNGFQGPPPPVDASAFQAEVRPVDTHGYQATAEPETVAAVIDDFLEAARSGKVASPNGHPYEPDEVRDLRWSLRGYVASDLGATRMADLSGAELRTFVGRLDADGFSQARTRAVVRSLQALTRYAAQRGMVPWAVADSLGFGDEDVLPRTPHVPEPADTIDPAGAPATATAPALAALSSGSVPDEVIWLILKIVSLVFALIALVLVAESV